LPVLQLSTVLAFAHFSRSRVDAAVIEVGLGGLTDATNVLVRPWLTVLTSIALEHTHLLGGTTTLIAQQKAGIMKPHTPCVIGPTVPCDVIEARRKELGLPPEAVVRVPPSAAAAAAGTEDFELQNQKARTTALLAMMCGQITNNLE
jgi:folylpolyglutamate synthase/dihydropteroate synthase